MRICLKETSPTTFEVEQTLQTMPSAKTLTLDGKTGHILPIAAGHAAPTAPAAAGAPGRGGRGQIVPGSFTILEVGK